jgi:ABC-type dipeptide/oligopeptide/nickel transport system ATPase subunit
MASNDYEKKLNVDYETDEVPVHAVRGIDINVDEGQFFTLLGPSGCSKTTTLRALAGLDVRWAVKSPSAIRPCFRPSGKY